MGLAPVLAGGGEVGGGAGAYQRRGRWERRGGLPAAGKVGWCGGLPAEEKVGWHGSLPAAGKVVWRR